MGGGGVERRGSKGRGEMGLCGSLVEICHGYLASSRSGERIVAFRNVGVGLEKLKVEII